MALFSHVSLHTWIHGILAFTIIYYGQGKRAEGENSFRLTNNVFDRHGNRDYVPDIKSKIENKGVASIQKIEIWGWTGCRFFEESTELAQQLQQKRAGLSVESTPFPDRARYHDWLASRAANYGSVAETWRTSPLVVIDGKFVGGSSDFRSILGESDEDAKQASRPLCFECATSKPLREGMGNSECWRTQDMFGKYLATNLNQQYRREDTGVIMRLIPQFKCKSSATNLCEPWLGKKANGDWTKQMSFTLLNKYSIVNKTGKPYVALFRDKRWGMIAHNCQHDKIVRCTFAVDGYANERHNDGCGCVKEASLKKSRFKGSFTVLPSCDRDRGDWCDSTSGNRTWSIGGCAWKPDNVADMLAVYKDHKRDTGAQENEVIVDTYKWNKNINDRIAAFLITPQCQRSKFCSRHFKRYRLTWEEMYGPKPVVVLDPSDTSEPFKSLDGDQQNMPGNGCP